MFNPMSLRKKYGLVAVVWIVILVAILVTNSFLPPLVKENFELYEPYEYSQMYLENESYRELIIEYDHVQGREPSREAMDLLEKRVEEYTSKEVVVSKIDETIPFTENLNKIYDEDDISYYQDRYRSHQREDETIVIHVLYLDGVWKENERALGLARRPSSIVIFKDVINSLVLDSNLGSEDVEQAVLVHEFGHLLSLVGVGYESEHEDLNNPHHCDESEGDCVMAASVEVKGGDYDQEAPPNDFCHLCRNDLEYIRGKEEPFGFVYMITYAVMAGEVMIGAVMSVTVIFWKKRGDTKKNTTDHYELPPYEVKDRHIEGEEIPRREACDHTDYDHYDQDEYERM